MIKDEIGFLSEWTAYYEMHGFDHIMFFDNNSTTSLAELDPWIKSGFVTIHRDWWVNELHLFRNKKNKFGDMMRIKVLAELECKRKAVEWGYEVFLSVDVDEYVFPTNNDITLMDNFVELFNSSTRGMVMLTKLNFPPTPHYLEPINLLTIEAYQTRMNEPGRMNYYTNVANKVVYRLQGGPEYTNDTTEYIIRCCFFHGCWVRYGPPCVPLYKNGEQWRFDGKHRKWIEPPRVHHYARSLEKYALKQLTWETAGGGRGYDINNFLDRTVGWRFDNSATAWTCQLRDHLRNRTGEANYVRPGDWYRNPEFGRTVEDPGKRGRNGAGYGKYLGPTEMNPYPPGETYQRAHRPYQAPK
eukprot:CAMPEP_0170363914 /NCGR_PEP_ID=MMETSP0117_2-20130122/5103_1 /TAXON_ID=400756 /ORGANISM="Durinskia baltica, Strain CSIRO CS-38" /LENGTH=355 /DNA_ID=CAMNT_0010618397 /DNA_START=137 /DNA_END=1204 /DNA_ORIENTATION=+